jgi:hypothetical protein
MEGQKAVPFKVHEGISPSLLNRLLEKGKEYGLKAVFPFKTEKVVGGILFYRCYRYPQKPGGNPKGCQPGERSL